MQSTIYFALLAAVLAINAGLSFYHAGIAKKNHQDLVSMMEWADRDRVDAELFSRIKALEERQ